MTQTVDATFDGAVLRPETALALDPNTRVRLTVEVLPPDSAPRSFHSKDSEDLSRIQERIDAEDTLLHARTTIFLVSNGLLLASLGIQAYGSFRLVFVLLGVLVTIVWVLVGWQSRRIIRAFHTERAKFSAAIAVQVAQRVLPKPGLIRPVDLIALWLPLIFLLAWVLAALFVLLTAKPV